jgi:diguanylate cyclase (GGDEF)-like protein
MRDFAIPFAQLIGSLLLTGVLFGYWHSYRQRYLQWWAASFGALSLYTALNLLAGLFRLGGAGADDPVMLALALIYTSLGFLQVIALVVGLGMLARPRWNLSRRHVQGLLLICAAMGAAVSLPLADAADGNLTRLFLRIGSRYLFTGVALLGAALWLFRLQAPRHAGRMLVAGAFAIYGVELCLIGLLSTQYLRGEFPPLLVALTPLQGLFELVAYQAIGLGLVIWLLAIERARASQANERLQLARRMDSLTGLANERGLQRDLQKWFESVTDRATVIGVLGIDNFRLVNQARGMQGGDEVLQTLAMRLAALRTSELGFARLGGDEFVVYGLDRADTPARLEAIRASLGEPLLLGAQSVMVSCSLGWTRIADVGHLALALREARIALRVAKLAGGGRPQVYAPELAEDEQDWVSIAAEVEQAFEREEFCIYLQPIYATLDGKPESFEALTRWQHPRRGLLPPDSFLPQLQTLRLMPRLDRWILQRAIRCQAAWLARGLRPLPVAVNLTAETLQDPGLPGFVIEQLEAHRLPRALIHLEVTESMAMRSLDAGTAVLRRLADAGLMISVDDFGTGYSSLTYLKDFPAQRIKFDRSFIEQISQSQASQWVLEALVPLCRKLGKQVLAEGIETVQQRDLAQAIGFDAMQGYLFSRPLSMEAAEALLARAEPGLRLVRGRA